jgi:ethanolamine utilization cobalamin adenosyltransferase
MKCPLTELEIRQLFKKDESIRSLDVPKGTLLTPSALEFFFCFIIAINFTDGEE